MGSLVPLNTSLAAPSASFFSQQVLPVLYVFITAGGWGRSLHSRPSPLPFRGVTVQRKWIKGAEGQGLITPLCAETSDGQRLSVGHRLAAMEQTEEGGNVMSPRDRPVSRRVMRHGDGSS